MLLTIAIIRAYILDFQQKFGEDKKPVTGRKTTKAAPFCGR